MPAYCEPWPVKRNATRGGSGPPAGPATIAGAGVSAGEGAERRCARPRAGTPPRRAARYGRRGAADVRRVNATSASVEARARRSRHGRPAARPARQQGRLAARGQRQQVRPDARRRRDAAAGAGASSTHDVGVGAAEAEGADAGDAAPRAAGHGVRSVDHPHGQARPRGCAGSGARSGGAAGCSPCCEGQHHLDQAGDAGGGLEVADVGLDRADQQRAASGGRPRRAPRRGPAPRSDRRATCRCRAPRRSRRPRGPRRPGASASRITASWAGPLGAVRPLLAPVLVDRRAADHREHAIAVGQRRATGA